MNTDPSRPPDNVPVNRARNAERGTRNGETDRLPPHSIEAEQGVLGCILLSPVECVDAVRAAGGITPEWFYDLRHRTIFGFMTGLAGEGVHFDLIILQQVLRDAGKLEEIGGVAYLASLPDKVPSAANLGHYLAIVRDKFMLRRAISACTTAIQKANGYDGDVGELIDEVYRDIEALTNDATLRRAQSLKELLPSFINRMEEDMESYHRGSVQLHGLTTGFTYADKLWGGIGGRPGENGIYGIIAARPGDGKTTMAMQIAVHVATRHKWFTPRKNPDGTIPLDERGKPAEWDEHHGRPVCVFSIEMTAQAVLRDMVFRRAGVNYQKFRTGFASSEDFTKLQKELPALNAAPIYIDDDDSLSVDDFCARARVMKRQHDVALFIIDYVQLIAPSHRGWRDSKAEQMSDVSNCIRRIAKQLDTPIIALVQMNREFDKERGQRKPKLSDLRDSGSFEQDAHWVTFLYEPDMSEKAREAYEDEIAQVFQEETRKEWWGTPRKLSLLFAKNRHGLSGKEAAFLFHGGGHGFEDWFEWRTRHDLREPAKGERKPEHESGGML